MRPKHLRNTLNETSLNIESEGAKCLNCLVNSANMLGGRKILRYENASKIFTASIKQNIFFDSNDQLVGF